MSRRMRWLGLMLARSFASSGIWTVLAQAPDGQPRRLEVPLDMGSVDRRLVYALELPL